MLTPFFDRRKSYRTKASEFWPAWVLPLALYAQGILLGLRSGGLTWFARVNPSMAWGGMLAYSKSAAMASLPAANKARELVVDWPMALEVLQRRCAEAALPTPLVLKPDQGERGRDVYRLNSEAEVWHTLQQLPPGRYLLQEFLQQPYEFGVFVAKSTETERFEVLSLTWKVPLGVVGDGISMVNQLITEHPRAKRYAWLLAGLPDELIASVPEAGVWQRLHFSGNHCRGAAFIDARSLINAALHRSLHAVLNKVDGFRFGRLDVLVAQPEDLWNPAAIKVIEINGANAEPAHIYDPQMPFIKMLAEVLRYQQLMWQQARWMQKQGYLAPPVRTLWPVLKAYRAQMRAASTR